MFLYAVYLGGRAPGCNTELHDTVFVAAKDIESAKPRLKELWFGDKNKVHIDSYFPLNFADGYLVRLSPTPDKSDKKLYFINLGAYRSQHFGEIHLANFIVASSIDEAKSKAKERVNSDLEILHTDDKFDVDDCIQLANFGEYYIHLTPSDKTFEPEITNGYFPF